MINQECFPSNFVHMTFIKCQPSSECQPQQAKSHLPPSSLQNTTCHSNTIPFPTSPSKVLSVSSSKTSTSILSSS